MSSGHPFSWQMVASQTRISLVPCSSKVTHSHHPEVLMLVFLSRHSLSLFGTEIHYVALAGLEVAM